MIHLDSEKVTEETLDFALEPIGKASTELYTSENTAQREYHIRVRTLNLDENFVEIKFEDFYTLVNASELERSITQLEMIIVALNNTLESSDVFQASITLTSDLRTSLQRIKHSIKIMQDLLTVIKR